MAYIESLNSVDLYAACGLLTPEVSGVHDLIPVGFDVHKIPGAIVPGISFSPDDFRLLAFTGVMGSTGHTHAQLVSDLRLLRRYLRPDNNFHALRVADRADEEIMALCTSGVKVDVRTLPAGVRAIDGIPIEFLCYPYWQERSDTTDTVTTASDSVTNSGELVAYPVYTCTILATMATGLTFTVGTQIFDYNGALASGNTLVINTDPAVCSVTLNGASALANTDVDAKYPVLAPGVSTVSLSDYTKFSLGLAWRERNF